MALPCGRPLSLHLRRRPGPLLLAAAWIPGQAADGVHQGGHHPRVLDREKLCAALHRIVRPPGLLLGFLPRATERAGIPCRAPGSSRVDPDPERLKLTLSASDN